MNYHQKYESETKAREEAKKAYERVASIYGRERCSLTDEAKAVVLMHPDVMQGVVNARFEW
jgi:hypothetical protein